jgi:hypothetical protein
VVSGVVDDRRGDRSLQLDRATGGDHRGGEQSHHVAGAGADRANRCGRARPGETAGDRCAAARDDAAAGGGATATGASDSQQLRDHADRTQSRHERRELAADSTHL